MRKLIAVTVVICALATTVGAAIIDSQLKQATVFFFSSTNSDSASATPVGTGFYVSVPVGTNGGETAYLITARHVIHEANGHAATNRQLWLRIGVPDVIHLSLMVSNSPLNLTIPNTGLSNIMYLPVPLSGPSAIPTYLHPDPSVDLAALLFSAPTILGGVKSLPLNMFLTKDAVTNGIIAEGDDIFFTGLLVNHYGSARNIPVFRFGRVSMLSPEPINWMGKPTDLYLIESLCFGGNSGSPVFLEHGPNRNRGALTTSYQLFFAGVLIGHFNDVQPLAFVSVSTLAIERNNNGIAAVVPAYRVHELVNHPDLKKMRGESNSVPSGVAGTTVLPPVK